MANILLTEQSGAILGPISKILGMIMNAIYVAVYKITGVENIGISIILLTIVIFALLFPLTLKQQKFSKLNQIMQPELNKIRKKYEGKKDQESVLAMQQEQKLVYAKYGVSPAGTCLQAFIQIPILMSLYRVFSNVPAYLPSVKDSFSGLVTKIVATDGYRQTMKHVVKAADLKTLSVDFTVKNQDQVNNFIVDTLYKLPKDGWNILKDSFPDLGGTINSTMDSVKNFNYFFGLNISESPLNIIKQSLSNKAYSLVIIALLIPILSGVFQMISVKLMPQADSQSDQMAQQMKIMNIFMPLLSFFWAFTLPTGLGIYWAASGAIRSVQQFFINKHYDKLDVEELVKRNEEKVKKQREKNGVLEQQISRAAHMNTKSIKKDNVFESVKESNEELEAAYDMKKNAKPGSLASKANMVREFNEKNSRK
ncbi:YidC/Oxa1 family membrane protein insertase [Lachnospiraceae bacterium C7]|nr:YidC/Oxa1 family membrane protein insertase [Lachnospiraceae bacterium C7]